MVWRRVVGIGFIGQRAKGLGFMDLHMGKL